MIMLYIFLQVKLEDYVAVNSATAHPHWDADGTIHNLGNTYQGWPKTCLVRIPPKKGKSKHEMSYVLVLT